MQTLTVKTKKTVTEEVELELPIFKKNQLGYEHFAMVEPGVHHKIFNMRNYITVSTVDHEPSSHFFEWEDCSEEEFMEAWELGLKSMSFTPSLTIKNIEACPKF